MSNKGYSFNDIDAIIGNPPEELTSRANRSGKLPKAPKDELLEKFVTNVKRFIDSIPNSLKDSHPKINNAVTFLDQHIQYLNNPTIEPAAANKLLTEITGILIKEFEAITTEMPASMKQSATQLIHEAAEVIKLHHRNEIEKEHRRIDNYFAEE